MCQTSSQKGLHPNTKIWCLEWLCRRRRLRRWRSSQHHTCTSHKCCPSNRSGRDLSSLYQARSMPPQQPTSCSTYRSHTRIEPRTRRHQSRSLPDKHQNHTPSTDHKDWSQHRRILLCNNNCSRRQYRIIQLTRILHQRWYMFLLLLQALQYHDEER